MAARLATVADFPSEFDAIDSRDLETALREAALHVSEAWGEFMSEGHWLKAADILASTPKNRRLLEGMPTDGDVLEERVGPVTVKRGVANSVQERVRDASAYGQRYESLRNSICVGPLLTI